MNNVDEKRICEKTLEYFKRLSDYFSIPNFYYDVDIIFSNRMTKCAGQASCSIDAHGYTSNQKIKYSNKLFARCTEDEQDQTIAHEVCHAFEYKIYGKGGHGPNWREMMDVLGKEAKRCHSIDRTGLERKQKRYPAKCGCQTHMVSGRVRKNILLRGAKYLCNHCNDFVTVLPDNTPEYRQYRKYQERRLGITYGR